MEHWIEVTYNYLYKYASKHLYYKYCYGNAESGMHTACDDRCDYVLACSDQLLNLNI